MSINEILNGQKGPDNEIPDIFRTNHFTGIVEEAFGNLTTPERPTASPSPKTKRRYTGIPTSRELISAFSDLEDNFLIQGKFEVQRILGKGGYSTIALVKINDPGRSDNGQEYAVKFFNLTEEFGLDHVLNEIRITKTSNHPKINRAIASGIFYDYGKPGEKLQLHPYMVMEPINGVDLRDFLDKHIDNELGVPASHILKIAIDGLDALAYEHERGIVHRDVKLGNFMITPDGRVVLVDHGTAVFVAKEGYLHYTVGDNIGTFQYLSPEQARGEPVDHRSDLYQFGLMLDELAVGLRHPWGEDLYASTGSTPEQSSGQMSSGKKIARRLARDWIEMHRGNRRSYNDALVDGDIPSPILEGLEYVRSNFLRVKKDDRTLTAEQARQKLEEIAQQNGLTPDNQLFLNYWSGLLDNDPNIATRRRQIAHFDENPIVNVTNYAMDDAIKK